jgi:hypothetical protein
MAASISLDQLLASPGAAIAALYRAAGSPQADAGFDLTAALQGALQNPDDWRSKVGARGGAAQTPAQTGPARR